MDRSIARRLDYLLDHHQVLCVFLAQFILTWCGVGNQVIVCLLGLLLCAEGFLQRRAQADLWVLLPLAGYNLFSMAASFAAYGNIADGFAPIQTIFPVLYLLTACLGQEDLRLLKQACVIWTGVSAAIGLGQFTLRAAAGGSFSRLGGFLGNPNAMGIFLVLGWFALIQTGPQDRAHSPRRTCLEPVLLAALALTLSMGAFLSMALGVVWLTAAEWRRSSPRQAFHSACRLLAKAALGVGSGLLLYLAASRTGAPWLCLLVLAYLLALAACWPRLDRFLTDLPPMAVLLSGMGLLVAAAAVAVRPSAFATFAERLDMMASAAGYLTANPLLGVGPYRWRLLDLYDGGTYFNTWHIHNALLHVGVELGLPAMAMLAAAAVRGLQKKKSDPERAELIAFFAHNMMDTSFFYTAITSLALLTAGQPQTGGRKLDGPVLKLLFGAFAAVFAFGLWHGLVP